MSRFIDKLNQVSQAVPLPMGFKAVTPVSSTPKMLLVASLARADVEGLADYVAGADAGLLVVSKPGSGVSTFKKISQAVPAIPWGGWLRGILILHINKFNLAKKSDSRYNTSRQGERVLV